MSPVFAMDNCDKQSNQIKYNAKPSLENQIGGGGRLEQKLALDAGRIGDPRSWRGDLPMYPNCRPEVTFLCCMYCFGLHIILEEIIYINKYSLELCAYLVRGLTEIAGRAISECSPLVYLYISMYVYVPYIYEYYIKHIGK